MTLLAAYNFDEASGNILDSSGNARTVTFGGALTRVTGHTSTGLSQSSAAADSAGPALTGMQTAAFTIMGWVKRTANTPDGWLLEYKQAASGDRGFLLSAPNIQARVKNVAGTVFTAAVAQPTAATAYHAAATCDGSFVKLFINGVEVASTAFTGGVRTNSTSSSFIDGLGTETWLDDARYYDAALDAATITTAMNTPVASGGTSFTQTPVDAEGLTDARVFDLGKVTADPEALTDAALFDLSKAATDPLGLTDTATVVRGLGTAATDPLGLTDAATTALSIAKPTTDPLPLTDTTLLERAVAQAATDSLGTTDQVTTDRGQVVSDPLGLTDAAQVTTTRTQPAADTCGLSDQIALVITRDLGDTITTTDAADLTAAFVRVFTDTAALADTVQLDLATRSVDLAGLTDSATVTVSNVTTPIPGRLTAGVSQSALTAGASQSTTAGDRQSLTATDRASVLTATTESTSRLEA